MNRSTPAAAACLAALLALPAAALAETDRWTDPVSGSWFDAERWASGTVPNSSQTSAALDATGAFHAVTLDTPVSLRSLDIDSEDAWLFADAGIGVSQDVSINAGGLAVRSGAWLHTMGDVRIGAAGTLWHQDLGTISIGGDLVSSGHVAGIPGQHRTFTVHGTFHNFGTVYYSGHNALNRSEFFGGVVNHEGASIVTYEPMFGAIDNRGNVEGSMIDARNASHTNRGTWRYGTIRGAGLTNLESGTLENVDVQAPTTNAGTITLSNTPNATSCSFKSLELTDTSVIDARLIGPGATMMTVDSKLRLAGRLEIRPLERFLSTIRHPGDYSILSAPGITGAFDAVDIQGLEPSLSASLLYTDTTVYLRVIPTPGSVACIALAGLASLRRRASSP